MPLFRSSKLQSPDLAGLRSILVRLSELCIDSDDSDYSYANSVEIAETLQEQIKRIDQGKKVSMKTISFLMLPTGPLQETSIYNGWAQEFLQLSAELDDIEKEPAYKRAGISLDEEESSDTNISRTSVNTDDDDIELRQNNSFLHDNVD